MRKSTILVLILLGFSLSFAPTKSTQSTTNFELWRPDTNSIDNAVFGCHNADIENIQVSGEITFDQDLITIDSGDSFNVLLTVERFGGNITTSSDDLSIGFNILDGDNADFTAVTISEVLHEIVDGNSVLPYEASFTALSGAGNYTLIAYAVAGNIDYFHWVTGQLNVIVEGEPVPTPPVVEISSSSPIDDIVTFEFDFNGATNIESVEIWSNDTNGYEVTTVTTTDPSYELNVSSYNPNSYTALFNITNAFNLSIVVSVDFEIPVPVTTTPTTTSTTTTTTPTETDPQETEDPGFLGTPTSVSIILVMGFAVVGVTIVASRKL